MVNKLSILALMFTTTLFLSCGDNFERPDREVQIPEFNFEQSLAFEPNLSAYNIFQGNPSDLLPAADFHLLELSSTLFTDYSYKQRLVKIPQGSKLTRHNIESLDFPDGTILTKTFFYYNDENNKSGGKRILETRLLIKESEIWNLATYVWNEEQTDAILKLDGLDTDVQWIDADGDSLTINYHVPSQNDCMTCHQSNSKVIPLGTKLRNMNRLVNRGGVTMNQLSHLQSIGVLNEFQIEDISVIADYKNLEYSLEDRVRAYLDLNCSHCHNPNAWEAPTEREFDFRYETTFLQTGIFL